MNVNGQRFVKSHGIIVQKSKDRQQAVVWSPSAAEHGEAAVMSAPSSSRCDAVLDLSLIHI